MLMDLLRGQVYPLIFRVPREQLIYYPDSDPLNIKIQFIKEQNQSYWFRINDAVDLIVDHKRHRLRLIPGFIAEHERLYLLIYTLWMLHVRQVYWLKAEGKTEDFMTMIEPQPRSKMTPYHRCAAPRLNSCAAKFFLPLFPENGYPEELSMKFAGPDFGVVNAKNKRPIRTIATRFARIFHQQPYLWIERVHITPNAYDYHDKLEGEFGQLRLKFLKWLSRGVSQEDLFNLVDIAVKRHRLKLITEGYMNSVHEICYRYNWSSFWNCYGLYDDIPAPIEPFNFSTDRVLQAVRNYLQSDLEDLLWNEGLLPVHKIKRYEPRWPPLLLLMFADWPFQLLPFGPYSFPHFKDIESSVLSEFIEMFYRTQKVRHRKILKLLIMLSCITANQDVAESDPALSFLYALGELIFNIYHKVIRHLNTEHHSVIAELGRKYRISRRCQSVISTALYQTQQQSQLLQHPEFETMIRIMVPYLELTLEKLMRLGRLSAEKTNV